MNVRVYTDISQCQRIWETVWPVKGVFDLWSVRICFHNSFKRPLRFHTVEKHGKIIGLLPLSWCEESSQYVLFPGETWQGKTWIEQNHLIAKDQDILYRLIESVPGNFHLRYLSWEPLLNGVRDIIEDEVGYLFHPKIYDYNFENYWLGFSGKSRKKIRKELDSVGRGKVCYRFNQLDDIEQMFKLNTQAFLNRSYFHDLRFYNAFKSIAFCLKEMGMLRITTILIEGVVAAVDMGIIFNNTYTLMAGGTNPMFKGVAKLINLHHIEFACLKRIDTVDFLCGDFNWKKRFHLTPRPLYKIACRNNNVFIENEMYEEIYA